MSFQYVSSMRLPPRRGQDATADPTAEILAGYRSLHKVLNSPEITLKSVVLPAPLAPITARRSPAATDSETLSIARRAPNVRPTPSRTSA